MVERQQIGEHDSAEKLGGPQPVRELLVPSLQDMQQFQSESNRSDFNRCDADFYRDPISDFQPTAKRKEYWRQAREALNEPDKPGQSPSPKELEIATEATKQLQEFTNRDMLADFPGYRKHEEQIRQMFRDLDPKSTESVLAEINRQLKDTGYKVAQAESGEIWLGRHSQSDMSDKTYYINVLLKEAPGCLIS